MCVLLNSLVLVTVLVNLSLNMNNLIITIYLVYLRYEKFDALFFELQVDTYAYLPPNYDHSIECDVSATIVVFERRFVFCTSPFI